MGEKWETEGKITDRNLYPYLFEGYRYGTKPDFSLIERSLELELYHRWVSGGRPTHRQIFYIPFLGVCLKIYIPISDIRV